MRLKISIQHKIIIPKIYKNIIMYYTKKGHMFFHIKKKQEKIKKNMNQKKQPKTNKKEQIKFRK